MRQNIYLRFEGVILQSGDIYLRFKGLPAKYPSSRNRMTSMAIRPEYFGYRNLATP